MSKIKERKEYMTAYQAKKLENLPRTHRNCLNRTGVARPGKTAQDHARNRKSAEDLESVHE
jgi:hypothetical protein